MIVKLIQPRMIKRPMDTDIKLHMAPPLGLLTVAAVIRAGHQVTVENENIGPVDFSDSPDVVGLSVTVDVLPRAMEIAGFYRRRGIPVVAGGIHITTAADSIPEDAFDALCIGAAEGTWPEIMRDLAQGTLQKRYRCQGPLRGEDIVSPAYDLVKTQPYLYCNVVHTSRGCPFHCDFCYNSGREHQYVNRRIEDVLADIRKTCRPDDVRVQDDIALVAAVGRKMSSRPGISGRLFKALGDEGVNIRTIAQGADELAITVGVDNKDFEKAIRVLYDGFAG